MGKKASLLATQRSQITVLWQEGYSERIIAAKQQFIQKKSKFYEVWKLYRQKKKWDAKKKHLKG